MTVFDAHQRRLQLGFRRLQNRACHRDWNEPWDVSNHRSARYLARNVTCILLGVALCEPVVACSITRSRGYDPRPWNIQNAQLRAWFEGAV